MGDFSTLNVALTGLRAARFGIDTAANNVSNVSTAGHTRQRVDLSPHRALSTVFGFVGTGVDITGLTRSRDAFLDARVRSGASVLGALSARSELLLRSESILSEPDLGISVELSALWAAFEDLSLNPPDGGARQNVIAGLDALAGRVRSIDGSWEKLGLDAHARLVDVVAEANGLLREAAALNRSIAEAGIAHQPNDLLDRRDVVVDRLSVLIGAEPSDDQSGMIRIGLGGMALVSGTTVNELAVETIGTKIVDSSGVELQPGGEAQGYRRFLTTDLPAIRARLDTFVEELATALNQRHALGYSETGPGGDLLTYTPGMAAATLQVAIVDPGRIATAMNPGPPFPVYDGDNAVQLAALRSALVADGGTATPGEAIRSLVTELGRTTASAVDATRSQNGLQEAAELARMNSHGVSLDEEMVSLVQYQHAYEAAGRVMTAVDEALETLVRRTGLVGR